MCRDLRKKQFRDVKWERIYVCRFKLHHLSLVQMSMEIDCTKPFTQIKVKRVIEPSFSDYRISALYFSFEEPVLTYSKSIFINSLDRFGVVFIRVKQKFEAHPLASL